MSFITGTNVELIYANTTSGTAKASFTTEVAINDTAGMGPIAHLPPDFWVANNNGLGRVVHITARGILSSTATPTYTFTVRLGAAGSITAAIVLGSVAVTTGSGVTNQLFTIDGDIVMRTIGAAGANSTVQGIGWFESPGIASPFGTAMFGGAASPGTVATVDTSITNYINFDVTCSASAAGNSIQLLQLLVFGLN